MKPTRSLLALGAVVFAFATPAAAQATTVPAPAPDAAPVPSPRYDTTWDFDRNESVRMFKHILANDLEGATTIVCRRLGVEGERVRPACRYIATQIFKDISPDQALKAMEEFKCLRVAYYAQGLPPYWKATIITCYEKRAG